MPPKEKKIWFPAKRYGWGWGPPVCWQGWVVIILWIALLIAGQLLLRLHLGYFAAYLVVMMLTLIGICYWKGEKPHWRWGKD